MAQISVTNPAIIAKLQTDQNFRQDFISNTSKTLTDMGYPVDEQTVSGVLSTQLQGVGNGALAAASTFAIITIF